MSRRTQWPSGISRGSAADRLLGFWFWIPPGVCLLWLLCVLSGTGLCNGPITRLGESYRLWCVILSDAETSRMRRPWPALGCCAQKKKKTTSCPSWPCGLTLRSAASRLLGSQVRILVAERSKARICGRSVRRLQDAWRFVLCVLYNKDKRQKAGQRSTDSEKREKNIVDVADVRLLCSFCAA